MGAEPKFGNYLDENAVVSLADSFMPHFTPKWWQFWKPRWSAGDRERLRFALRTFLLRARDR